jgi:hypothetical protein
LACSGRLCTDLGSSRVFLYGMAYDPGFERIFALVLRLQKRTKEWPMAARTTTAIVALLLSAPLTLAQDRLSKADLVQLVVTLGVYDNRCERLAPRLLADLQRMVRLLGKDDVMAGVINEHEKVDSAGEAEWCDRFRPVVEKYKDGLLGPTRP